MRHEQWGNAIASRDEVYTKFGITAEAAQLFETELGTLLLGAKGIEEEWHSQPDGESARKMLDGINDATLGQLLSRLRTFVDVNDEIANRFKSALKTRNRLFHGFFERHNFKIETDAGRDKMIADLEALHVELFGAWQIAGAMSSLMMKAITNAPTNDSAQEPLNAKSNPDVA